MSLVAPNACMLTIPFKQIVCLCRLLHSSGQPNHGEDNPEKWTTRRVAPVRQDTVATSACLHHAHRPETGLYVCMSSYSETRAYNFWTFIQLKEGTKSSQMPQKEEILPVLGARRTGSPFALHEPLREPRLIVVGAGLTQRNPKPLGNYVLRCGCAVMLFLCSKAKEGHNMSEVFGSVASALRM